MYVCMLFLSMDYWWYGFVIFHLRRLSSSFLSSFEQSVEIIIIQHLMDTLNGMLRTAAVVVVGVLFVDDDV